LKAAFFISAMILLLSKSSLSDNYSRWLRSLNPEIQLADAYRAGPAALESLLRKCSGMVLTGGSDINPSLYGNQGEINRCEGIDNKRDQLEIFLVEIALDRKIPILAICRGIQVINTYFSGKLYVDIASDLKQKDIHRGRKDVFHSISITTDSGLFKHTGCQTATVSSSHHQALKEIGNGLIPVARAEDGITEAVELDPSYRHPFFTGVQWHPERMDIMNPMSGKIGRIFLEKTATFKKE
jgi:putative glutamine amidotransferase